MPFLVLIGVSVSGKTTITREIKRRHVSDVFYFDRVGVPPTETTVIEYGSGEAW